MLGVFGCFSCEKMDVVLDRGDVGGWEREPYCPFLMSPPHPFFVTLIRLVVVLFALGDVLSLLPV